MALKFLFRLLIKGPLSAKVSRLSADRMPEELVPRVEDGRRVFELPPGRTRIGSAPDSDLILAHSQVSPQHAWIDISPSGCTIENCGEGRRTFVGEVRLVESMPLVPGQAIKIGPFTLVLERIEAPDGVDEDPLFEIRDSHIASAREAAPVEEALPLPGLAMTSVRLLQYLPAIYHPAVCHTDFMSRLLALFESILLPIEWSVDGFDLCLSPRTAPAGLLPWLASWYGVVFDASWGEMQRRDFLAEAYSIHARRGTGWALSRALEIYTGRAPEIDDDPRTQGPSRFTVKLLVPQEQVDQAGLAMLINALKPAHTAYRIEYEAQAAPPTSL